MNIRYYIKSIFILLIALCSISASGQTMLSRISVSGNHFVNEQGQTIVFRGLNTSDPNKLKKEGHWNKEYFDEMAHWGANIVRFPVHPQDWRERGSADYLKLLDEGVKWASELNMHVIIDWHSIGNLKEEIFHMPSYRTSIKETTEFWDTISKHFKGNTTVAFFELFNEPTTREGEYGNITWLEWKSIMEDLIAVVRKNENTSIPLIAGFNWAYDLTEVASSPIDAPDVAYVSHPYPQKREIPWPAKWTADWGFVKDKYPVVLTEVGFCGPHDRGAHVPVIGDDSYGKVLDNYCDDKGISYVVWVFDPQWSPMLFSDWSFKPTTQGKYFKQSLQEHAMKTKANR
ncbi:glycoside hydrolase family 5 protein [Fulvivirga maritima]|uniref:glycoside hydrolase family 5 protein n=1 Tax=Fulvivirga maritima TaxID=2904247 RepID=UPI001F2A5A14|nr:cellulase family glycosylhydrolase [Fulvivirga maritima]UII25524.1 glycoside hydrolase family 5 protein [Fulvivirga maritima]